jgi:muramoyltetrapeptide carboxypeptidase LdcA involved in peptidoglycan recycling
MDFGHTYPAWTLPIGPLARVDPSARTVHILGPAVTRDVR